MSRTTAFAAILGCIAGLAAGWWLRPAAKTEVAALEEALPRLAGLKHLRFLDLRGTPVSDEAHAAYVKDHPDCRGLR